MKEREINLDEAIAYLITWTCYGTWMPGDERGWHRWGHGDDLQPPNQKLKSFAASEMKDDAFYLDIADRRLVESTIRRHSEVRGWELHAANARTNHVHVVVGAYGYSPKTVRDQYKAWCTRLLKRNHPRRRRFWTEGASCRYINQQDDLVRAIEYAGQVQDRKEFDR